MKILFTTIMYNRPKVSEIYLLGLQRLKEIADFDVLVIVSDEASAELCNKYEIKYYYHENLPLGLKHNFMFEKCLEQEFDYVIHSGDDDVISNDLFAHYVSLFANGEHEYIKAHGLYFYDLFTHKALDFQPKNTFGAFRAFKRELIERVGYQCHVTFNQSVQIGGKQYDEGCMYSLPKHLAEYYKEKNCCIIEYTYFNLWGNDKNHGLDFSSESKLIESGVKAHIVKFDDPQIIDFKSEQNIWSFKRYWTMSTDADTEKVLSMLSEAEREKVLHFANC